MLLSIVPEAHSILPRGRIATGHNHAAPACRVILLRCMSLLLCTNAKCSDVRYLVAVKGNADVADIAFL
jgi:hypothetical protein